MSAPSDYEPPPDTEHMRGMSITETHHHHHANGNGVNAKLYNVVLMVAAGAVGILLALVLLQQQQNGQQLDELTKEVASMKATMTFLVDERRK